ncbi:MAG: type 1 glutamine amidotransferase domain-containing protein [Bacteroidota bacterium]
MKNYCFLLGMIITLIGCHSEPSGQVDSQAIAPQNAKGKILFIVSNAQYYGQSKISTANHFAEIVLPYDVLIQAGYEVDFVSPEGGAIPLGYLNTSDSIVKQYLYDAAFMDLLEHTKPPSAIKAADYQAVYYGGGGSAMFGVPENESIQKIAMEVYEEQNGIISAVCHGTAGIVHLKTKEGKYLVAGKSVNGFPDLFENKTKAYYREFPFSIEQIIRERGGNFQYSENGWDGFFQVDGHLITGQDPTAAASVAQQMVEVLKKRGLKT